MKLTNLHSIAAVFLASLTSSIPLRAVYAKPLNDDNGGLLGGATVFICCALVLILNIALLAWVAKDASSRGTSAGAWLVIVLLFGILGLLAYLVARPQGRLMACPNCSRQRPITSIICPHCGYREGSVPRT